jgi:predicted permease
MSNRENRGYRKPFTERDYCYKRVNFGEYGESDISESKYPTFILRLVRLFGFLTFTFFFAAQRVYSCGGKISREEHARRVRVLALFATMTSMLLVTAGYFGLSLIWSHAPYKGVSQALLFSLLFLFYLGIFGMCELLGFRFAYDKDGFLQRSPVNIILGERRAKKSRLKQSKMRKTRYGADFIGR